MGKRDKEYLEKSRKLGKKFTETTQKIAKKLEKDVEISKKLTPRLKNFVKHYFMTKNSLQSAITAGYSKNGAHEAGRRALKNAEVQRLLACYELQEREAFEKEYNLTMKDIRRRLARIALGDVRQFTEWTDSEGLKLFDSEDIEDTYALKSISTKKKIIQQSFGDEPIVEITKTITLDDRQKALIKIGESIGGFKGDDTLINLFDPAQNLQIKPEQLTKEQLADRIKFLVKESKK
jgi:hypothetical protein